MEKLFIQAIIPYMPIGSMTEDYFVKQYNAAIKELKTICDSEQFEISYLNRVKFNFNMYDYNKESLILKYLFCFKDFHSVITDPYFVISIEADLDTEKCIIIKGEEEENNPESAKYFIADNFAESLYKLFFTLNIAKPGCITIRQGIVVIDGKKYKDIDGFYPLLQDAYNYSLKLNYPECFYEFSEIYNLLNEIGYDFYNTSQYKLEIAINCLTYILSSDVNNFERLLYSMIGLEALYTKGNTNILEQLNDKIQIYLGQLTDYKKIIKDMYALRSRYLHGDMPIKPFFLYDNTSDNNDEDKIYNALSISSMLLIRTIQKMLIDRKKELNFEYKLI